MIDEKRLTELKMMVFDDAPQSKPCPTQWEIYKELFDTIEILWRVARAAEDVRWFVMTLSERCDDRNPDDAEYIAQQKEFMAAVDALHHPGGVK